MIVIGYAMVAIAAGWFLYKVYASYKSAGGTDMMMSVYDGATYPPIIATVGLYLVLPNYEINWSFLIYIGIWLGSTVFAVLAIRIAEEIGDRPLR